jgi:tight adherence protein B
MTRRRCSKSRRTLRRSGPLLVLLLLLGFVVGGAVSGLLGGGSSASAATGDLTLDMSSLDLSAYPKIALALQLGGPASGTLSDLTKDAVYVKLDGSVIPVDSLEPAGTAVAIPLETVLLIDESGSMKGDAMKAASTAAATFIDAMRPEDKASVQSFNNGFRTLEPMTGDKQALKDSLSALNPQRDTLLYDAVLKSLASITSQKTTGIARYIILLSDGGDTASTASLDDVLGAARISGVPIYTIGLQTQEFDAAPLQQIAEASGGRYIQTTDPAALTSIYQTLAKELHNQYLLTFTVPASLPASGAGHLSVQVTSAGNAAVAEQGFFFPEVRTVTSGGSDDSGAAATTTTTVAAAVAAGNSAIDRFLEWSWSGWIIGVVVFLLVVMVLYLVWGALFPKRDVLAEYGGVLDRKSILEPQALDEERPAPNALSRVAGRALALRGYQDPLQRLIDDASLKFRASEFAVLQLIALVVVIVVAKVAGLPLFGIVILALVFILLPLVWLQSKGNARRKKFNEQVPNTLMLLAGSLKAGQALEQALNVAAMESPDPTSSEFQRVLAQVRLGVLPEEALNNLAERMRSEAFGWVVMSTVIQRQVGGNLAEIYESTAQTLRERAKLRREVETLTAEGRISAIILVILPFAVGGMVGVINRGYLQPLLTTTMGNIMLAAAFILMIIGIFWMRAIVRVDK